jgi:hypothetical protein
MEYGLKFSVTSNRYSISIFATLSYYTEVFNTSKSFDLHLSDSVYILSFSYLGLRFRNSKVSGLGVVLS